MALPEASVRLNILTHRLISNKLPPCSLYAQSVLFNASTLIYASMLEYIYLHAWALATNRERGGEAMYMDKNPMRNRKEHADN